MPNHPALARPERTLTIVRDDIEAAILELDEHLDTPQFSPTRERPCPEMRPRGVYLTNIFDAHGNPIIEAIGADHRRKAFLPWTDGRTLAEVWDEMEYVLAKVDPAKPLELS